MQRRQLHRNARPARQRGIARAPADRIDRPGIGLEIALGIVGGAGALAQHVEGIEKRVRLRGRARAPRSMVCTEHEMRAEQPHGLPGGGPHRRQAEPLDERVDDSLRRLARVDHFGGDAQRPGRSRHQQRGRAGIVMGPVAASELVLDQPVGGGRVGHPQQRLGQHHQRQPLLGGQRIGVQEVLNPAETAAAGADRLDQPGGARIDASLGRRRPRRGAQQDPGKRFVRRRIRRAEGRNVACGAGGLCRLHDQSLQLTATIACSHGRAFSAWQVSHIAKQIRHQRAHILLFASAWTLLKSNNHHCRDAHAGSRAAQRIGAMSAWRASQAGHVRRFCSPPCWRTALRRVKPSLKFTLDRNIRRPGRAVPAAARQGLLQGRRP